MDLNTADITYFGITCAIRKQKSEIAAKGEILVQDGPTSVKLT